MEIAIKDSGAFSSVIVHLDPGESFVSESGAMYRASANMDIDITTKPKGSKGGLLAGVKRLFASESFFFSTYKVTDGAPGEVGLSPTFQGEIRRIELRPSPAWLCSGGSYLASSPGVELDTQFQGLKGLFTGESLSFMKVSGQGVLLVSAYGALTEISVDGELIVDTGHLVAYEDTLSYKITKAGGSWLQSFLGGEGFVMRFEGQGKVLVQSHNPSEMGKRLGPMLPPREG